MTTHRGRRSVRLRSQVSCAPKTTRRRATINQRSKRATSVTKSRRPCALPKPPTSSHRMGLLCVAADRCARRPLRVIVRHRAPRFGCLLFCRQRTSRRVLMRSAMPIGSHRVPTWCRSRNPSTDRDDRMQKYSLTVLALMALSCASAKAQQQSECFVVLMTNSTDAGNLGAIRTNKCTGETWVLSRVTLGSGAYAVRWFPINVEKAEAIQRPGQ